MKLIKLLVNLGGIILFYGVIAFMSLILVVSLDKKEEPFGNRCVTEDNYNFNELFKSADVKDINYHLGCNTYYVNVYVNEDLSKDDIKVLLIKYSLIKQELGIETPVEVVIHSSKPYFARLLDEGKISLVGN